MKHWLAVMALGLTVPATAHASDMASARAFVSAWNDLDTIRKASHVMMEEKLQRCVKAGYMTETQIAGSRTWLDNYLVAVGAGMDTVNEVVATKAATIFSTAEMRSLTTMFSSKVFRRIRSEQIGSLTSSLVPRVPGCGDESHPANVQTLGAQMMARLSSADRTTMIRFARSPAGQHFARVAPVLVDASIQAYRDVVGHALQVAGVPQSVADSVKTMPSLITFDPPKPAPDMP